VYVEHSKAVDSIDDTNDLHRDRTRRLWSGAPEGEDATAETRAMRSGTEETAATGVLAADPPRARSGTAVMPAPAGPTILDRYRLVRQIGTGGFGVVWLARDERLERDVAVKVLPRAERTDPRAQREAFAAARLNHPGIVALYELADDEDARYLVSELVRGRTLGELTAAEALSDRDVARIGIALCDALEHAHAAGVVHRDVKPANVMIPDSPAEGAAVAKLMDFGIAQLAGAEALTRTGDVVGTLAYMAPEQAEGRRVTAAADLYSLGLVLYEALAGEHPIRRAGAASTARRIGGVLPSLARKRRDLPAELTAAVERAVRPRPAERGDLHALRAALVAALPALSDEGRTLAGSPIEGLPPPPIPRHAPRLAAAVAAGALTWVALGELGPAPPAAPAALGAGAALAVALLPRLGWLVAATGTVAWLAAPPDGRAGAALLVGLAAVAVPILLPRDGRPWSLPAAAPILGLASLAGAFPALAGQARAAWQRAALGALGFWWLALAEPLLERDLYLGRAHDTLGRAAWETSGVEAAKHVVTPLASSGALAMAAVWALLAAVLPWLVRGRRAAFDIVGATAWGAGLAAATGAVGQALSGAVAHPHPRGAVAGAVVAALFAVAARAVRGEARTPHVT
jgi:hypothetical protein